MRLGEAEAGLRCDAHGDVGSKRAALRDQRLRVASAQELHRHVRDGERDVDAGVEHANDVRRLELSGRAGLEGEARDERRVLRRARPGEHLHGDASTGVELLGLVHRAHAPLPEQVQKAVTTIQGLTNHDMTSCLCNSTHQASAKLARIPQTSPGNTGIRRRLGRGFRGHRPGTGRAQGARERSARPARATS